MTVPTSKFHRCSCDKVQQPTEEWCCCWTLELQEAVEAVIAQQHSRERGGFTATATTAVAAILYSIDYSTSMAETLVAEPAFKWDAPRYSLALFLLGILVP